MTRDEILELCRRAPNVGEVKHEDFIDYIVILKRWRRVEGEWEETESAYMSVDGKIAMANSDHRLQGKRLDFENPVVLENDDQRVTLMVFVVSEIYGRRHGIATSRKLEGAGAEQTNPWETAETSAIGRALSTMGYGVLPGAGLASAEDMVRVLAQEVEAGKEPAVGPPKQPTRRRKRKLSRLQLRELTKLYRDIHGGDEESIIEQLEQAFQESFGANLEDATYRQGGQMIARLMAHRKEAEPQ